MKTSNTLKSRLLLFLPINLLFRESEFDEEDEDKSLPPDEDVLYQDIEIDVEKVEKIEAFFSSDEEDFGKIPAFLSFPNC